MYSCGLDQLHGIADGDTAWRYDMAVETEPTVKFPSDPPQHTQVLLTGIRVKRGHDAARAEVFHPDNDRTNPQLGSFPPSFREPRHVSDNQIRPESPEVVTHGREHSVGCYQQGKDIETVVRLVLNQAGSRSRRCLNIARNVLCSPRPSIHQDLIVPA